MKKYYMYFGINEQFATLKDAKYSFKSLTARERREVYNYNEGNVTIDCIADDEVVSTTEVRFSDDYTKVNFGKTEKY